MVEELEQVAAAQNTSREELLNKAVSQFLYKVALEKMKAETAAYERMHAQLITEHLGEHVAIHNGQMVDHDSDLVALRKRIRQRFGRMPILLREVTLERVLPELLIRRPKLISTSYETTV
ncbi:MAG: hypothetical protein KDE53_28230 [Caldilineaceae bacterium]|nr:hypothetical protein [Caldilineaceae bacterium]